MAESSFPRQHRNAVALSAVVAVTALVYVNAFRNRFIYFDDPETVFDNTAIREFSWVNLQHWFTTPLQFMYTPLVWVSLAVDHRLGGLAPGMYHATNLVLHLCNVVLVYRIFRALTRTAFIPWFVTVAFALHPVNADTVSWVSARSTLLVTLCSLGTLLAYVRYRTTKRWPYLAASLALFVAAVLSKSTAVALPVSLFLLDWYRGRRPGWRMVVEKVPFVAVAVAAGLVGLHFRIDTVNPQGYTVVDRIVVAASAMTTYLGRLVFPYPLSFAYAYPVRGHGPLPLPWWCYLAPLVPFLVAWVLHRAGVPVRTLVFGFGFFVANLVLTQTALLIDNHTANRYAYLPYLGLFLVLASLAHRLVTATAGWRARLRFVWLGLLVAYGMFFSMLTFQRSAMWNRPVDVLSDAIRHEPRVPFLYTIRGLTEYRSGDDTRAAADFDATISLDRDFMLAYYYQGMLRYDARDYPGAIRNLDTAIALSPGFGPAYQARGDARQQLSETAGACDDWRRARDAGYAPGRAAMTGHACPA